MTVDNWLIANIVILMRLNLIEYIFSRYSLLLSFFIFYFAIQSTEFLLKYRFFPLTSPLTMRSDEPPATGTVQYSIRSREGIRSLRTVCGFPAGSVGRESDSEVRLRIGMRFFRWRAPPFPAATGGTIIRPYGRDGG